MLTSTTPRRLLVTAALLASAVVAPGLSAAQAAEAATCHGRTATVTLSGGTGGSYTAPDSGDAVIVVTGGTWGAVNGNAGNDAICLLGDARVTSVSGAGGDDVIDTSMLASHPHLSGLTDDVRLLDVSIYVNAGNDTVAGGPAWESVQTTAGRNQITTGDGNDTVLSYAADDTISTGAGDDLVRIDRGAARVDLGDGDDDVYADDTSVVTAQGGSGADRLHLDLLQVVPHSGLVDLEAGFYAIDARTANKITGIEDLTTSGLKTLRVRGSDEANDIVVQGCQATVGAAGGADTVLVGLERCLSKAKRVEPGFRAVSFAVRGGPGADHLESDTRGRDVFNGGPGTDVVIGGGSDDVLRGGSGSDRVVGHGGLDAAYGGNGRDTCRAERRTSC